MARRSQRNQQNQKKKKKNSYLAPAPKGGYRPPPQPKYNIPEAAQRDVNLYNQPQLQEIAAQQNATRDFYKEADVGARNIHQGLMNEMNALPGVGQQYNDIAGDLNTHLGGLASQMGNFGTGPAGEQAADSQVFGQMGVGSQNLLAGQRARSQDWTRGVQSQAHVDLANRRANYLETMRDELQKLQENRLNVFQTMPDQLKQRQTELQDQRFQQGMARADYGLQAQGSVNDEELRQWLIKMMKDKMGNSGGGGGGGGKYGPGTKGSDTGRSPETDEYHPPWWEASDKALTRGIQKRKSRRRSVRRNKRAAGAVGDSARYSKFSKQEEKLTKSIKSRKKRRRSN